MNIPVIFRNLRGYDNHFIMQEIGQIVKKKNYTVEKQMKLNVIPNNMEKNMWLSCLVIGWFSLTVSNLCQAVWTSVWVISQMRLLKYTLHPVKKKWVYPYDYMCSFDKLNDTQLPEKEYEHAQKVW